MEIPEILKLYDEEMRRRPTAQPGDRVEDFGGIVRIIGEHSCVLYSNLRAGDAREAVVNQTAFFRSNGKEVEWKLYGHDQPPELAEYLRSAGYAPDPVETLEIRDLARPFPVPSGSSEIEIRHVRDEAALREAVAVSEDAFGPGEGWGRVIDWTARLNDPSFAGFVAYRDGVPVASGRLELPPDRPFASLWGGGTAPGHRGLGIYRRLVHVRAEMARERGYRFLTVDARETSRPILESLGFRPIDTIRGWLLKPSGASGAD